jgi:Lhr-like helicase
MPIEFTKKKYKDDEIKKILHPLMKKWFIDKFKTFSEPQRYAIMNIHSRINTLVSAPTGSGKTLTAFTAILNDLIDLSEKGKLEDKIYCVYISPLKALNADIAVNLIEPLKEIEKIAGKELGIRIGVRTGDTTPNEKQKMLKKPPHILITTPESLGIILASIKFKEHLKEVQWTIVDEIHALAENKRGVHLSLSLERLEHFCTYMTRVGLSATVAPLEKIAYFLVGEDRDCQIVDVQFLKKYEFKVLSPVPDLINTTHDIMHRELYKLLDKLIQKHKTTLIFTNTRAATERVVDHLKDKFPKSYSENIGAHHGSLGKDHRFKIEQGLRDGKLKVVVSSTSLELGIDIGHIDLVICLGSPKSVARFLQRCLPPESEILLADGTYKKIGEIVENKLNVRILSIDEKTGKFIRNKISKYHKNKYNNKLIKICAHSGLTLKCTKNHPIMTREGWKKAKDIKINEEIAELFNYENDNTPYIYELLNHKMFYVENKNDFLRKVIDNYIIKNKVSYSDFAKQLHIKQNHLQNYMRRKGRRKSIRLDLFLKVMKRCKIKKQDYLHYLENLKTKSHFRTHVPLKPTKELMWLAGIVASDGSITYDKKRKYYHIKISNKDKALLEECRKIYKTYGYNVNLRLNKIRKHWHLDCGAKWIAEFFIKLGIIVGKKSFDVYVSNGLYKLPKELIIPFIEGVIEGDGNVSQDRIRIFTASKKFASGLHNLLNKAGIHNYFNKQEAKISKKVKKINSNIVYCIHIGRSRHLLRFMQYSLFKGKKLKQVKKKNICHIKKDRNIDIFSWTKVEKIQFLEPKSYVYNLTLEKEPNNYFVESILTHNCGRAGHALHATVKGRIIVMDRDDLIECAVLMKAAIEKKIDKVHIPTNCLDVLAQQIDGFALDQVWEEKELFKLVKKSYCYKELRLKDYRDVLSYLAGEYVSLEDRYIYAKIWRNEGKLGKRGKMGRVIYMTNIGTIPDESFITVKIGDQIIGMLDEGFLERMRPGDVFVLGGNTYQFKFSRGMVAQVSASASRPPTVPSWFSEMLPLSFDLSMEIQKFRMLMEDKFKHRISKKEIIKFINTYLYVDNNSAEAIYQYFIEQWMFCKHIPHDKKILIENYDDGKEKKVIFHALYGRRVNDVLSRAVAFIISRTQHKDIEMGINDNGFYINSKKGVNPVAAFRMLKADKMELLMKNAVDKSEVLRRRFRHCAARSLMILRNYKGRTKRVGRQQVSSMILLSAVKRISNDFSILKEARREVLEDLMDIESAIKVVRWIENGKIKIVEIDTKLPSPFSFNLALQGYIDVLRIEDKVEFIKRMHEMVTAKISLKEGKAKVKAVPDFDYKEMWRKIEEERLEQVDEETAELKMEVWNLKKVPGFAKTELIRMIDGHTDIRLDVLREIDNHKTQIKKNWPKKLSKFILERKKELD